MKNIKRFNTYLVLFAIITIACSCKNDEVNPEDKNDIVLSFENRVGDKALALGTGAYVNSFGEDFTVTTLNYFISNVSFTQDNGTVVKIPDSYFLIKQSDANSLKAVLKDVPVGDYTAISFMVGVDSSKSVSDISQLKGVLDPTSYGDDGMYWAWNSGYIFFKLEGTSSVVPSNATGKRPFQWHVGGFGGFTAKTVNNLRKVTLPLSNAVTVRKNITPQIQLVVDMLKVFNSTTPLKLAETNMVHSISAATPIADNYQKIFSVDYVHNDAN